MPKVVKITAQSINLINRNYDVSRSVVLKDHIGNCFMVSMNPENIAYPWIIWTEEQLNRYYELLEPLNSNKFTKVKRSH